LSLWLKRSGVALLGATLAVMLAAVMLALSPAVAEAQIEDKNNSSVVVRPGDTLWSISEERLGQNATPQQIYNEAARIYALNSKRIGEDPNLIYPGEVLLLERARAPVDAPASTGRPARGLRPASSERAPKKAAAAEPSRDTAQRSSREASRDLARGPSHAPAHQPPELAPASVPKPVAELAPEAASGEERALPLGRLLLAALAGTATAWGTVCFVLAAALMARKLPMRRYAYPQGFDAPPKKTERDKEPGGLGLAPLSAQLRGEMHPREASKSTRRRKSCPPHTPLIVRSSGDGHYFAQCLVCGLGGPDREDASKARLAFEEYSKRLE
jgi:hypothetical protein